MASQHRTRKRRGLSADTWIRLPLEIILRIPLWHAVNAGGFTRKEERNLLSRLSRVCRDWMRVLRPLLFRDICISSASDLQMLYSILKSSGSLVTLLLARITTAASMMSDMFVTAISAFVIPKSHRFIPHAVNSGGCPFPLASNPHHTNSSFREQTNRKLEQRAIRGNQKSKLTRSHDTSRLGNWRSCLPAICCD